MQCHKCPHFGKFEGQLWEKTPCCKCTLKNTREHVTVPGVGIGEDETGEEPSGSPTKFLVGSEDDPLVPLSVLGVAMACWVSLTLPAREVFRLRMNSKTLEEIAKQLNVSKVAVYYILQRAIKENPVMASLACGSKAHRVGPKFRKTSRRRKWK
jgi:hypothetical protein